MHTNTNSTDRSKFAPPALTGTVPRRQLLSQFAAVPTPCKWLCAPSGSGKSTLIAGYARQSDRHVAWYRLDARDDDPGFFFATFAAALSSCLRDAGTLPAFHDADTGREKAFAERFFAAMLVRVRVPALWVFDDVQRIGADWLFEALAQLVQRNAPDLEVVFVSETPPPPAFFDAIVARQLSLANDFDLRFSADECSAIAQLARLAATRGEEIYALTGGHAGAVILACEFLRAARPSAATAATVNRQLHSHLLGKLAENLPEELRDLLLRTSSLPSLTVPIVDQLLGRSGSGELLEALADRGLLVRYTGDDGMTYEAHGLVRAAAKSLAASLFGAAEAQKQGERCARLLEANDRLGDAFALWLELGAEEQALDALDRLAPRLAGKRQPQILLKAMDRLPADRVGSRPWILFWAGESMLGIDERRSCDWFERAHQAFDDRSRSDGRLLSSAAALTALNSDPFDLGVIKRWIERLAADRRAAPELHDKRLRAIYLLGVVCAANLGERNESDRAADEAAFEELIAIATDPAAWSSSDQMLAVARTLIEHAIAFYSTSTAEQIALQTQPLADDEANSPLLRGKWWVAVAELHSNVGAHDRFAACIAQVDRLRALDGSHSLRFLALRTQIDYWMRRDDMDTVIRLLPEFEKTCAGGTPQERAQFGVIAARALLRQRRFPEALAQAQAAIATASRAGQVEGGFARVYEVTLAFAQAANGEFRAAADRLHALAQRQDKDERDVVESMALCLDYCASAGQDLAALRRGLGVARGLSFHNILQRTPDLLSSIFAAALAHDIEPEFVRRVIEHQRLRPPPDAGPEWPWPVRIWTLGGFRLEINGAPYRPAHKAQDKPLELLKLLVAAPALGRDVPEKSWVAEQLWPDAEEPNARKSLEMTLARLRRIVGSDQIVEAVEGKLAINRSMAWVDVRSMLTAAALVLSSRDAAAAGRAATGEIAVGVEQLLATYGGRFLQGEDESPWVLGARTKISRTFCTAIAAADALSLSNADERWVLALERALMVEPTAEELARILMQRYLSAGRHAEALSVYRRCKDMLSITLGVAPSTQTEVLRTTIYQAAAANAAAGHTAPPALQ